MFPTLTEAEMRERLALPTGKIRLLIDTDAHNEIDDQFAIAWSILSQDQFDLEGVVAEPYSQRHHKAGTLQAYDAISNGESTAEMPKRYVAIAQSMHDHGRSAHDVVFVDPDEGMELSYQEILKVFDLMEEDINGRVHRGSPDYLQSYDTPIESDAAKFIIERAMADDDRPLYIGAIGCVTNIASAILMEPEIIKRIVVTWTSSYPSYSPHHNLPSLNLMQDPLSSQLLFDCGVPHVYLPGYYIGEQLKMSLPDMERWVKGTSKIGNYLYEIYENNPLYPMFGMYDHFGRTWVIWDLINFAWLMNPDWVPSMLVKSPILTDDLYWKHDESRHWMREATHINRDAIFRDFFTKLEKAP